MKRKFIKNYKNKYTRITKDKRKDMREREGFST